jgi:hypothetical protein
MKSNLSLSFILMLLSLLCKSQDTTFFIGNSAVIGIGVNKGDYKSWPYKADHWSLTPNQKNFIAEYQVNAGKLFTPLSKSYSFFFLKAD